MAFERNFIRYLAAKKTVDDRALNRNVWGESQMVGLCQSQVRCHSERSERFASLKQLARRFTPFSVTSYPCNAIGIRIAHNFDETLQMDMGASKRDNVCYNYRVVWKKEVVRAKPYY